MPWEPGWHRKNQKSGLHSYARSVVECWRQRSVGFVLSRAINCSLLKEKWCIALLKHKVLVGFTSLRHLQACFIYVLWSFVFVYTIHCAVIAISLELFVVLGMSCTIVSLYALWFYYEVRVQRRHADRSRCYVYHCVKCSLTYSSQKNSEKCNCPKCGFNNLRLKF